MDFVKINAREYKYPAVSKSDIWGNMCMFALRHPDGDRYVMEVTGRHAAALETLVCDFYRCLGVDAFCEDTLSDLAYCVEAAYYTSDDKEKLVFAYVDNGKLTLKVGVTRVNRVKPQTLPKRVLIIENMGELYDPQNDTPCFIADIDDGIPGLWRLSY